MITYTKEDALEVALTGKLTLNSLLKKEDYVKLDMLLQHKIFFTMEFINESEYHFYTRYPLYISFLGKFGKIEKELFVTSKNNRTTRSFDGFYFYRSDEEAKDLVYLNQLYKNHGIPGHKHKMIIKGEYRGEL